jgi:hypothetical protein
MGAVQSPVLPDHAVLEPKFKITFMSLIALTGVALLVYLAGVCTVICLGVYGQECPPEVQDLLRLFSWTWKAGFMAVVALNVGKAVNIWQLAKASEG